MRQSVSYILRTPVGSRMMCREYGSLLSSPERRAKPSDDVCLLQALLKWEPRVTLTSLTIERQLNG
ncbi:hypothetical protein ACCW92_09745 [Enterobacter soli]|uniref:hypothetical protein n=1 Tax=Enterobacter soli TaxID=885040 RepID=UPI003ED98057